MRALGKAIGALLDLEPTAGTGTVFYKEQTGAEVTSTVAMTRHPLPPRWRIDSDLLSQVDDGTDEWTLPAHGPRSSRPTGTSLLVPFALYPIFPDKAPILGRSTDDWMPVNAREIDNGEFIVVTVEKMDNPEQTGTLTVDTSSKIIRHMDLGWITIEVTDWSPMLQEPHIFTV